MGIRPSVSLVMGMVVQELPDYDYDDKIKLLDTGNSDDRSSERFHKIFVNSYLCDPNSNELYNCGEPKGLGEVLHETELWDESYVFGYEVESQYNNRMFWAIQGIDEKFQQPGYMVVPSHKFEETTAGAHWKIYTDPGSYKGKKVILSSLKELLKTDKRLSNTHRRCKFGHCYKNGEYDTTIEAWIDCAKLLFDQVGQTYTHRDIQLMLVWDWS